MLTCDIRRAILFNQIGRRRFTELITRVCWLSRRNMILMISFMLVKLWEVTGGKLILGVGYVRSE